MSFTLLAQVGSEQIIMGTEPTKTNFQIMGSSAWEILKKAITGKGLGVLEINTKANVSTRDKYLALVIKECPECEISSMTESHGQTSYKITFPNNFYIVASIDAGTLEWQTKPTPVSQFSQYVPLIQKYIFDLSDLAGATYRLKQAGGHISISGFGGDSFWISNLLKHQANQYFMDWGFFGKDSYNANLFKRWKPEQQKIYHDVLNDHNESWRAFLIEYEQALSSQNIKHITQVFKDKNVMTAKTLLQRLSTIYYNPKQVTPWLGKRSKSKYVAHRPDAKREMIENRAIRPQVKAQDLLLFGKYYEAESWFIKNIISQGFEIELDLTPLKNYSQKETQTLGKKLIEMYKLSYEDYQDLTLSKSTETHESVEIKLGLKAQDYSANKRDELFHKTFSMFIDQKDSRYWELLFLSEFINETSYTRTLAVSRVVNLITAKKANIRRMSPHELIEFITPLLSLEEKFPEVSSEYFELIEDLIYKALKSKKDILTPSLTKSLFQMKSSRPLKEGLLRDMLKHPSMETEIALKEFNHKKYTTEYLNKALSHQISPKSETFYQLYLQAKKQGFFNQDEAVFHLLSQDIINESIEVSRSLYSIIKELTPNPLSHELQVIFQDYFSKKIEENNYARINFYQTLEDVTSLFEVTAKEHHQELARELIQNIQKTLDVIIKSPIGELTYKEDLIYLMENIHSNSDCSYLFKK